MSAFDTYASMLLFSANVLIVQADIWDIIHQGDAHKLELNLDNQEKDYWSDNQIGLFNGEYHRYCNSTKSLNCITVHILPI